MHSQCKRFQSNSLFSQFNHFSQSRLAKMKQNEKGTVLVQLNKTLFVIFHLLCLSINKNIFSLLSSLEPHFSLVFFLSTVSEVTLVTLFKPNLLCFEKPY